MIKQINITQGTPEWHSWRQKGLGASDVAALFNESPYKTKRDLWFEKSGFGESDEDDQSFIFRRGHETEAEIRELFLKHTKIEMTPTCFERDEIFLASLDGYDKSMGILEAKLVGRDVLKQIADGELPRHHWIQVQAQLFASDSDKAYYGARAPKVKDGIVVEVGRDEKFLSVLQKEVLAFWESLRGHEPPKLSKDDTLFITDPKQQALFKRLSELKLQKDAIESAFKEIEEQVKAIATHPKVRCGNVSITETQRSGLIDYAKIPEVNALAAEYLESFRKEPSVSKTLRFKKEA